MMDKKKILKVGSYIATVIATLLGEKVIDTVWGMYKELKELKGQNAPIVNDVEVGNQVANGQNPWMYATIMVVAVAMAATIILLVVLNKRKDDKASNSDKKTKKKTDTDAASTEIKTVINKLDAFAFNLTTEQPTEENAKKFEEEIKKVLFISCIVEDIDKSNRLRSVVKQLNRATDDSSRQAAIDNAAAEIESIKNEIAK